MKLRLIFWIVLGSLISGLLFWRNAKIYPFKPVAWQIVKSACEITVLLASALWLPVVLISWCSIWLTGPIKATWAKATVGAIAGVILGAFALYSLELLLLIGVFSIDEITGERDGFLKNFRQAKQAAARA
jgi:hypothetical protein